MPSQSMITETGTTSDFKHCILEQVWIWEFACGHVLVTDVDYQEEYNRLIREGFICPRCGSRLSFDTPARVS